MIVLTGADQRPIKAWFDGVPYDYNTVEQLRLIAKMPFIHRHVAAMPDAHVGIGATVGTVIATKNAIIPAAVGVDIGCGMEAMRLPLTANDLPDSLSVLRSEIEAAIPLGSGGAYTQFSEMHKTCIVMLKQGFERIITKHPEITSNQKWGYQLGTLGSGNHFIELCLDENDDVWLMLHSGSRGIGNKIGRYFIEQAKEYCERHFISLPHQDLAYVVRGTSLFDDYWEALNWAQTYAQYNRAVMLAQIKRVLAKHFATDMYATEERAVSCHHNYATLENHFGENVYVTRKGAVRAREGDLGIIPGSMGTGSFIVRGKGNRESFCSCSHGAGRVLSRGKAKELISLEDHKLAMQGIEARLDEAVLDESPAAYKDIGAVMAAQDDLVEIVHRLRQVLNVKG